MRMHGLVSLVGNSDSSSQIRFLLAQAAVAIDWLHPQRSVKCGLKFSKYELPRHNHIDNNERMPAMLNAEFYS